jgi:hypothetical protein
MADPRAAIKDAIERGRLEAVVDAVDVGDRQARQLAAR